MRIFILGLSSVLMAMFVTFNTGCVEHPRSPVVGIGTGAGVHKDDWRKNSVNNNDDVDDQDRIDR
jgi:hypothetical protein